MEKPQKNEEYQKCGWIFMKKVKWKIKELSSRKLWKKMRHMIRTSLKQGELKIVDYEAEKMHYCDQEKASLFGENKDEAVDGIQDSYIFKTN